MDNHPKLKIIMLTLAFLIASAQVISAIGVSSPYWNDNPLKVYPGQIKEISFALTNPPNEKAEMAYVSLLEGVEIAEITSGTEYNVKPGSTDTKILLKLSIPENAKVGDSYNIQLSVKSAPTEEKGTVQLNIGYNVDFPVLVVAQSEVPAEIPQSEQAKSSKMTIFIILALVVIATALIFLFIKRRNKN